MHCLVGYGERMRKDVARALLGLCDDELDEIRINEAYRAAIQLNHPDRYTGNEKLRKHAEKQCKLINQARDVLLAALRAAKQENQTCSDAEKDCDSKKEESWECSDSHCEEPKKDRVDAVKESTAPLLDVWQTSAGASILGVALFIFVIEFENYVPASWLLFTSGVRMVYMIFQLVYALVFYGSYFSLKPKARSSKAVSFLNCAVGGPVFGPLWNSNLTKKTRGFSNIVFAILEALLIVSWFILFYIFLFSVYSY